MGHTKDARDEPINKTKQNKNKEKIRISWYSESGVWPHTGGRASDRRGVSSRFLLLQRAGRPPPVQQDTVSLCFLTPARDQETAVLLPTGHLPLAVSMAPSWVLFSCHGHLPLPGFSCDPASLSPRIPLLSVPTSLSPCPSFPPTVETPSAGATHNTLLLPSAAGHH